MANTRLRRIGRRLGLVRAPRPYAAPPDPLITPEQWADNQRWVLTDEDTPDMNQLRALANEAIRWNQVRWRDAREAVSKTHVGFRITCEQCDSDQVYVENAVHWSEESGIWGTVSLICADCGVSVAIFEPEE